MNVAPPRQTEWNAEKIAHHLHHPLRSTLSSGATYLAILLIFLAGCQPSATPTTTQQPFQGQKLQLLLPEGQPFAASWDLAVKDWSVETGAEIEVKTITTEQSNGTAALPTGSLAVVTWPQANALVVKDRVGVMSPGVLAETHLDWNDVLFGVRENLSRDGRQPAICPLTAPVLVCFYREDLLSQAKRQPPETWDDYQKLAESIEQWAPGQKVFEPWHPEFRGTLLLARSAAAARHPANYSVFLDIETGASRIASPPFEQALHRMRAVAPHLSRDSLSSRPIDVRKGLLSGQIALGIGYLPAQQNASEAITRPDGIRIGIAPLPGESRFYDGSRQAWDVSPEKQVQRVPLAGFEGWTAVVSRDSSAVQTEAAWNLLQRLTLSEQAIELPIPIRTPVRESQTTQPDHYAGSGLTGTEPARYVGVVANQLRNALLLAELPCLAREKLLAALNAELQTLPSDKRTDSELLQAVHDRWEQILDGENRDLVRRSYRRRIGLVTVPATTVSASPTSLTPSKAVPAGRTEPR